ncbi:reverse transcriptase domain-containing protein [Tanacetum coccineum]
MSAYSGSSRRQSYHSSRGDTERYYQSSRSRGTEPAPKRHHDRKAYSRKGGRMLESEDSAGGHWKSKSKKQRSSMEDEDLSQPWVWEETDPFTPRIRYFDLPKRIHMPSHVKTYNGSEDPKDHLKIFQAAAKVKRWAMPTWCHMFNSTLTGSSRRQSYHSSRGDTESYYQSSRSRGTEPTPKRHHDRKAYSRKGGRMSESIPKRIHMPSHVKTYNGSEDPKDHLKIFQAAAKVERWAMPTWCHMFNSTLTGNVRVWFDDLLPESIDSYDDLKEAFLANYLQQKKCIKDPVEIHYIKQREGESTEDFVRRFKIESRDVKGAPEVMRISGFMHGITNLSIGDDINILKLKTFLKRKGFYK